MNIDKILSKNNGLTIHKGCFNCKKFEECHKKDERKTDYMEIHHGRNNTPYRAGCCCSGYESDKERVEFT